VLFDASRSNVLVGAAAPAELTADPTYTVEAWLNCPSLRSAEATFLSWTPRSTVNSTIAEYRYYNHSLLCEHFNNNVFWGILPVPGQWHHVAVTRNGATSETVVYVDGMANSAQTVSGLTIRSDGRLVLGGTAVNDPRTAGFLDNWGYNGYMGSLRISAGAKSAASILATYNAEAPAYGLLPISNGDGIWTSPGGGNWSDGFNWDPGTPVSGAGKVAGFPDGGGSVVNNLPGLTLLGMIFGTPATDVGGNAITFPDGGFIRGASAGTNTVSAPLVLNGTFTAAPLPGGPPQAALPAAVAAAKSRPPSALASIYGVGHRLQARVLIEGQEALFASGSAQALGGASLPWRLKRIAPPCVDLESTQGGAMRLCAPSAGASSGEKHE
jgi:hypothetical protein